MSGHITIPDEDAEISYVAAVSQTAFDVPFRFFATTDVQVAVDGVVQGSGYTVTGTAVDAGYTSGTLTFTTPLAGGETVLIYRSIPVERTSDFPYPSSTLEVRTLNTELDRIVATIQDGQRSLGRALRVPDTEPSISELPAAEDRADGLLGFDADGNPTILTLGDLGGVVGPQGEQGPPGQGAPIGAISAWAGATAPTGWLFCFGQAVSRTTYADLFGVIGTNYGAGDGSTTFNLPDLRGRFALGKDDMGGSAASRVTNAVSGITATTLGATGGSQLLHQHTHSVTDAGHSHTGGTGNSGTHNHGGFTAVSGFSIAFGPLKGATEIIQNDATLPSDGDHTHTVTINSNTTGITIGNAGTGASQNIPPAIVLNFIICYAYVNGSGAGEGGTVSSVDATTSISGLSITGGPIISAGTLTLALSSASDFRGAVGAAASTLVGSPVCACIPVGDETTAITTGTAKITFRMPFAMTLTAVRASLTTAGSSLTTVDINEGGTSILSTKLTIDASEKTSTTAATAAVISDSALADDAEMTIDIDGAGTSATGLKVYLIGTRA